MSSDLINYSIMAALGLTIIAFGLTDIRTLYHSGLPESP